MTVVFELPWPPSVNHYWRTFHGRVLLSRAGRRYRTEVVARLAPLGVSPRLGPLAVRAELYPPDRRRRDCDNVFKAVGDALAHAGVYADDSQIVWLLIERVAVWPGGKVVVQVVERDRLDVRIRIRESASRN